MRFLPSRRALGSIALLAFAGALAARAQPHLVADLHRERVLTNLQPHLAQGVEHGGVLYFSGQDPQHGRELWRTDGTPEGTYALADLCPGSCDGLGEPLGFFAGHLYFRGDDREHGIEIWRTDGTVGGEELLADLCPGTCGTEPRNWLEWRGALWFLIGQALWTSDGTAENTKPAADLCGDLKICADSPYSIFLPGPNATDEGLFLWIYSAVDNGALFRTDGTLAGTVLLHRFANPMLTSAEASGQVYFVDGSALWTSDGTPAGTRFVRNLSDLLHGSDLGATSRVVDGIFYVLLGTGDWLRSDGTAAGTIEFAQLDFSHFGRFLLAQIGGAVFAITEDGIWRTEGTPETTVRLDAPRTQFGLVVERPNRLYVHAYDFNNDFVWSTDGSANGFRRLHLDGPPIPDPEMAGLGEGVLISRGYRELWRVDGGGASAEPVYDFQPANDGSGPSAQVVLDHRLLFFSLVGPERAQLFSSDGSAAGTTAISPPLYGLEGAAYQPEARLLTRAGSEAFFDTYRFTSRFWETDGTREGTRTVKPGTSSYGSFGIDAPIGLVNGGFVFGASLQLDHFSCYGDSELWILDGRGTRQLVNLNPFELLDGTRCDLEPASSFPGPGVVLGRIALFPADDLVHGRELFATDGTKEGTRLVADLNRNLEPNPEFYPHHPEFGPELASVGSDPSDLVRVGSNVFFVADDGEHGRELWVTNGTRRGTRRLTDLVHGRASSSPHDLVAAGDALYFFAPHGSGDGLYKSDGTRQGTVLVSDLSGGSQARDLTLVRGKLFFAAFLPETGTELWTSEGTSATTRRVTDLRPGPRGSQPQNLKAVGARVVFAAADGTSGLEPWSSDGTAEGTHRWGDIAPGAAASTPGPFSVAAGKILFGADDGEHGRELWAMPVAELAE